MSILHFQSAVALVNTHIVDQIRVNVTESSLDRFHSDGNDSYAGIILRNNGILTTIGDVTTNVFNQWVLEWSRQRFPVGPTQTGEFEVMLVRNDQESDSGLNESGSFDEWFSLDVDREFSISLDQFQPLSRKVVFEFFIRHEPTGIMLIDGINGQFEVVK